MEVQWNGVVDAVDTPCFINLYDYSDVGYHSRLERHNIMYSDTKPLGWIFRLEFTLWMI